MINQVIITKVFTPGRPRYIKIQISTCNRTIFSKIKMHIRNSRKLASNWGYSYKSIFFFQLSTDQWSTQNKGSIRSFWISYNTKLSISTSVDLIILVPKKITALEKGRRISPTTCTNVPRSLGLQLSTVQWLTNNNGSITSFLVNYITKLSVSTSVESIIFVLKKITALKKGVRISPSLSYTIIIIMNCY